jgi:hypothetical protein
VDVFVRGGVAGLGGEKDHDQRAAVIGVSALWRSGSSLLGGSFDGSSRTASLYLGDVETSFSQARQGRASA